MMGLLRHERSNVRRWSDRAALPFVLSLLVGCGAVPHRFGQSESPNVAVPNETTTIFIASDSTASNYSVDRYPQSGWGSFLPCALHAGISVENRAIGGRSTRTFVEEGRWNALRSDLRAGDIVLIQFGHNDASQNKPERFAAPDTSYRQNLISFIADARAVGAMPVLLTPVTRRSFDAGKAKADFPAYSAIVRDVAAQFGVPLIDLESLSRQWLDEVGVDGSRPYFLHYAAGEAAAFPEGIADDTHFSELGARRIANLVAGGLAASGAPYADLVKEDRSDLSIAQPRGDRQCH